MRENVPPAALRGLPHTTSAQTQKEGEICGYKQNIQFVDKGGQNSKTKYMDIIHGNPKKLYFLFKSMSQDCNNTSKMIFRFVCRRRPYPHNLLLVGDDGIWALGMCEREALIPPDSSLRSTGLCRGRRHFASRLVALSGTWAWTKRENIRQ